MMTIRDELERRALRIVEEALAAPDDDRARFVQRACSGDDALSARVNELLERCSDSSFAPRPPVPAVTAFLGDGPGFQPGARVGAYRVERVLGSGGMGTVYEAAQERPHRKVALKVLHSRLDSPSAVRRFTQESEILARVRHPGVAHVYESGVAESVDGQSLPWFAMEHLDGARDLVSFFEEERIGLDRACRLFAQICDAVQYGHDQGVIHRDLKPSNLLVDRAGRPKVIDFGVARATGVDGLETVHTRTGDVVGTLDTMSPEQASGDPSRCDARSDVYALGAVLYQVATGRAPLDLSGAAVLQAVRRIVEEEPPRPALVSAGVPEDLDRIIMMALRKEPERRYPSVAELAADVRRFLRHEPVRARAPSGVYRLRKLVQRHRAATLAAVLLAVLTAQVMMSFRGPGSAEAEGAPPAGGPPSERFFDATGGRDLYTFDGQPGDDLGVSVADAGDFNGDGFCDVIAGARMASRDRLDQCGVATVYSGRDGTVLTEFRGAAEGEWLGAAVACAGDVNGDGTEDLVIGAPGPDDGAMREGHAHVYSGGSGEHLFSISGSVHGVPVGGRLGCAVAGAGDVDCDGLADLVIGARGDGPGNRGSVRVYRGPAGPLHFAAYGDSHGDQLGGAVAGAGDVDGDGHDDVIAGARYDDNNGNDSGSARVFSGADFAVLATLDGEGPMDLSGVSVSGAGDVDGDGRGDVIVGACTTSRMRGAIRVYAIVEGPRLLYAVRADETSGKLGVAVSGGRPGRWFDVDRDGVPDLVAGANNAPFLGQALAGRALVFRGPDGDGGEPWCDAYGASLRDAFGDAVSTLADVNGDGYPDFVVGGNTASYGGPAAGRVQVLSGRCGLITATGEGVAGYGGVPPVLAVEGCPTPGGRLRFYVSRGRGNARAFLVAGDEVPSSLPSADASHAGLLDLDAAGLRLSGTGVGVGEDVLIGRLPREIAATRLSWRVVVVDSAAPGGFAVTNRVEIQIR